MNKVKFKHALAKAICDARIEEKIADYAENAGDAWYEMGRRHTLQTILLAVNMNLESVIR